MKLDKLDKINITNLLLHLLERNPSGLRTSELQKRSGISWLSAEQIARLLRKSGKAKAEYVDLGMRGYNLWTLCKS
jgi:predicted DNA-binding transcriptional regulator